KIEFGDAGLDLWRITLRDDVTDNVAITKWESFSSEPTPGCYTINSIMKRGHTIGWKGSIRATAKSMFGGIVDQIAAVAGAQRAGAMPMIGNEQILTELGAPILQAFLDATGDAPIRPTKEPPALPDSAQHHGLFVLMSEAIQRIFALTEMDKW